MPNQLPRSFSLRPFRRAVIVLINSSAYIVGQACVKLPLVVLDDINAISHRDLLRKLVAGAGFEPAIRQLPDYEPDRKSHRDG